MDLSLLEAATRGDTATVANVLRNDASLVDVVDENGCSALQRASADGHIDVVTLLLKHGANPNKQDIVHGNTALHEASWKGYSRCVATLALHKANLHARNFGGFAAAHLACQNGHNQSCRELLIAGCDPDVHNNYGDTPLHTAARYGHAGVTRILISAECKVSEQNKNGDTALHIAAAMGRRKLTRILLEAGCDKSLRNLQRESARDIAVRKALNEILDILDNVNSKSKKRDKSKEKSHDSPDGKARKGIVKDKNDKTKKRPKTVHFEPILQWSPYGCHLHPDPKSFPKPKLDSLPKEPLQKGEQYYLDLAGNIRKGPIGAGYTCYCAPFFKHMEHKLDLDKRELKQHIDQAHERLDQKVTDLEMKTAGKISELTRTVAAERFRCRERHLHLEQWLTRGMIFRASERPKKVEYSSKDLSDISPMKRTRSLEIIDRETKQLNKVQEMIQNFDKTQQFENGKLNLTRKASRSADLLDVVDSPLSSRHTSSSHNKTIESLHKSSIRSDVSNRSSSQNLSRHNQSASERDDDNSKQNSERNNNITTLPHPNDRTPSRFSKSSQSYHSENRTTDSDGDRTQHLPNTSWNDHMMTRVSNDVRNKAKFDNDLPQPLANDHRRNYPEVIPQDGYIKIPSYAGESNDRSVSVQEMIAKVEGQRSIQARESCQSPEPAPRRPQSSYFANHVQIESPKIVEQPLRPAPVLKQQPQTKPLGKKFSLHNLIPFPTRKSFQVPPKKEPDHSESSEDDEKPVRTTKPGPMRDGNLLQTLPLPNYQSVEQFHPQVLRPDVPKDAYFHELPNRTNNFLNHQFCAPNVSRSRNPLYNSEGLFDPNGRIQHYSNHLDQNTEIEIANQGITNYMYSSQQEMLQNRLQSLAINTHISELQHIDRESHNDSGYSTKMYGSSQGPSPSLSGNVDSDNGVSVQRLNAILQNKTVHNGNTSHISASSLV